MLSRLEHNCIVLEEKLQHLCNLADRQHGDAINNMVLDLSTKIDGPFCVTSLFHLVMCAGGP